ncbi:biotin transport system substrate-specific component [Halobacillus karajensis]|uniref:Biotin transporter n=1 Tax=Halobacillus karajensis TaxID=195088 RepID=A0A024P4B4_9BACI|nr:biotin transporter BioY [Halobacillus karajensis]CDQ18685.1 Biotin ECF transporter S component BioY [Halobacillus karajensis]CDQ23243.1 Biotin ECF transporter S component BioY [Halobacillus karajensis]CDQ26725.1 Biotin ECF transporter S component BioY [Halobacillus karajensis]SEH48142.1 biotin transport system substrate-specific component [Halobacillus karajensis]
MNSSRLSAYDITLGGLFVALMAVGANITAFMPFLQVMGVPLTLQTFFAILAGLVLGSRLGCFSVLVYAILGLIGAPIFAGFKGGVSILLSPTFGFIVSYIILAYFVGKIAESKRNLPTYIIAALIGIVINYFVGVNLFYFAMNFWVGGEGISFVLAWSSMVPFLIKDLGLSIAAALFVVRLEKSLLQRTPLRQTA